MKGDNGNNGKGFVIFSSVDNYNQLPSTASEDNIGQFVLVRGGDLFLYMGSGTGETGPNNDYSYKGDITDDGLLIGPTGSQGGQGDVGPIGPPGQQGSQGIQGIQGIQGDIGPTGTQGNQGVQGDIGPTGEQGVQGNQGIQGVQGDIGPTGTQGNQGVQGDIGPTGPQGVQGVQGIQGVLGDIGPTGIQGAQGTQGDIGPTGTQGTQGVQGDIGPTGTQGNQGVQGDIGPTGPQGVQGGQGIQGVKGDIGPTGPQGIQGSQGDIGPTGNQGTQGIQGIQGDIGPTGSQGTNGVIGPTGPQGVQGTQGIQGVKGDIGLTGPQGVPGTAASIDSSVLKLGISTQTIQSGGTITVANSYILVNIGTNGSSVSSITPGTNSSDGTVIILQANTPSSTITVYSNNSIRLNNGQSCSLTGYNTLQLIYRNSLWFELSRTTIAENSNIIGGGGIGIGPATPNLSLNFISKTIADPPFSLTDLVTKSGTGALSFTIVSNNSDNADSIATIDIENIVTIHGIGTVTINVFLAASNDGLYAAASGAAILNVRDSTHLILDGITIKTIPTLSEYSFSTFPYFTYENPRGTGSEWFAIVGNTSKGMITSYANNYISGINYFKPTPELPPVIFNNIVTTFMTDMSFMFSGITTFDADIGSWDTSNVTNMQSTFDGASSFTNGGSDTISQWDTNDVTNIQNIFNGSSSHINSFANFNR